jgi:hypothetical protein
MIGWDFEIRGADELFSSIRLALGWLSRGEDTRSIYTGQWRVRGMRGHALHEHEQQIDSQYRTCTRQCVITDDNVGAALAQVDGKYTLKLIRSCWQVGRHRVDYDIRSICSSCARYIVFLTGRAAGVVGNIGQA